MHALEPGAVAGAMSMTHYGELREALAIDLGDAELTLALTHRSWAYEHGGGPTNERLEFLGDAVLGLFVTDALFRRFPDLSESQLAPLRSSVVNTRALAEVARSLDLGRHVLLGKGEEVTGGREKSSILADCTEAVIGAVYVEAGPAAAADLVKRLFDPVIEQSAASGGGDSKTALQELGTAQGLGAPSYLIAESGPDHAKRFRAVAVLAGEEVGLGEGTTKKEAEQRAATEALAVLRARATRAVGDLDALDGTPSGA